MRSRSRLRILVPGLVALLLLMATQGCRSGEPAAEPSPLERAQEEHCRSLQELLPLSLEAALDMEALEAWSEARDPDAPGGTILLSVNRWMLDPDENWVRPLDGSLPDEVADELAGAVAGALVPLPESAWAGLEEGLPTPVGPLAGATPVDPERYRVRRETDPGSAFRLRVALPEGPSRVLTASLEPSTDCPPILRNGADLATRLAALGEEVDVGVTFQTILLVDGEGEVEAAGLAGTDGTPVARDRVLQVAREARFTPARIDGFAVPARTLVPLAFPDP
ncbi:MAG: hypothetical protein EA352_05250 [Gemmatimonadales bacterium]|nr:MAG: hypothetical protein EA352_05250 [Gemmatimonadales bacterium]